MLTVSGMSQVVRSLQSKRTGLEKRPVDYVIFLISNDLCIA